MCRRASGNQGGVRAGRGRGSVLFQVVGVSGPGEHDAQVKTIAAVQPLFARHPDTYARRQPRLPKGVSSTSLPASVCLEDSHCAEERSIDLGSI